MINGLSGQTEFSFLKSGISFCAISTSYRPESGQATTIEFGLKYILTLLPEQVTADRSMFGASDWICKDFIPKGWFGTAMTP